MGWRKTADIFTGMQARDVVVKASYARALREEGRNIGSYDRNELIEQFRVIQETRRKYPQTEQEYASFIKKYPQMKVVEYHAKMGVAPTVILRGYLSLFYFHIADMKIGEAKSAVKPPIPDIKLPDITLPDIKMPGLPEMPSVSLPMKILGLFLLLLLALIALGYSGLGGAAGSRLEK